MFQTWSFSDRRMSAESLSVHWHAIQSLYRDAESLRARADQALEQLRVAAKTAGLGRELRDLESPTPSPAILPEAPSVKVKLLESFTHTYQNVPYGGGVGAVILVPRSFADVLIRIGRVAEVHPTTPVAPAPRS
jgi:hypothetical protein